MCAFGFACVGDDGGGTTSGSDVPGTEVTWDAQTPGGDASSLTYTCKKPGSFKGNCTGSVAGVSWCNEVQLATKEGLEGSKTGCSQSGGTWTDGSLCAPQAWCRGCLTDYGDGGCFVGWYTTVCDTYKGVCTGSGVGTWIQ